MHARRLGTDGVAVSAVGLGGMYMSIAGRPDEAQAIATIHAALEAGITLIDTADVYCLDQHDIGHSERLIAKALSGRRERVLVATKGGLERPDGAWTTNGRPEHLRRACEGSLRALAVERIDLYQLHAVDDLVPFTESVGALARLRDEGKIARVGLSNIDVRELEEAEGIVPIASVQNRWNPLDRKVETNGLLAACTRKGIAFLAYSPFGGARGAKTLSQIGRLAAEAARREVSPHKLVLAWMLAKSPVVIPIPGARRPETVRDSATAAELELSADDVAQIERAFQ